MSLIIPHQYTVDIANGTSRQKMLVPMVRGDGNAHQVTVTLLDHGAPAVTTGYTAVLYAVRAGDRVTVPNPGIIVGNVVTALIRSNSLYVNGRVDLLLTLTKAGDNEISPLWIEAECAGGVTDTYSDPENIIPSLSELLAQIDACEAATEAANDAADAITGITAEAETLAPGSPATAEAEVDPGDGHINLVFGIPQGGEGDKGDPGASITGAAFNGNDIVFTKDDSTTVTLGDAVPTLTGPQGVQGVRGSKPWYGTDITGNSTTPTAYATGLAMVNDGDTYIYTGTDSANAGNEYVCTLGGDAATALWRYLRNSRGVPGTGNVSYVDGLSPDGDGDVALGAIRYNAAQPELTDAERAQARANAGSASVAQALPTGGTVGQALIKSNATDYATEWAAVGRANPNLLHNWDFRFNPINQRGASGDLTTSVYFDDRWLRVGGTITIAATYLSMPSGSQIFQYIEGNALAGKVVTVSVMIGDVVYSATATFPTSTGSVGGDLGGVYSCSLGYETGKMSVLLTATASTRQLQAVKLEIGAVSTLANDAPANYGEQLILCHRFYRRFTLPQYIPFGTGLCSSATAFQALVPISWQGMRINPTKTLSGTYADYGIYIADTVVPLASMTVSSASGDGFTLVGTVASGLTPGQQCNAMRTIAGQSILEYSADY